MLAPNAEQIEGAAEELKKQAFLPPFLEQAQMKELHSFGDQRAKEIGASGLSNDFEAGYELGLQTARVVIRQSVALILKGVNAADVL